MAPCIHGIRKTRCIECGGASMCTTHAREGHVRRKDECFSCWLGKGKPSVGFSFCIHGERRHRCQLCPGKSPVPPAMTHIPNDADRRHRSRLRPLLPRLQKSKLRPLWRIGDNTNAHGHAKDFELHMRILRLEMSFTETTECRYTRSSN